MYSYNLFLQIYETKSGSVVGKLHKQYGGYIQETFTNADNFVIEFPENLALELKAVLIGTLFLIVSTALIFFLVK